MVRAASLPSPSLPHSGSRLIAESARGGDVPPSFGESETPTGVSPLPLVHGSPGREPGTGTTIDRRYALRREIARGGGGRVYEAEQIVSGRRVALKLVPPGDPNWVEKRARLMREARALVASRHPNVVDLLDAGTDDRGIPYLVMELLEGRALNGLLTSRLLLEPASVAAVGAALCRALGNVHRQRIFHRDIKPGNVFVTRGDDGEEVVKLIDFGTAGIDETEPGDVRITSVGTVPGTLEYIAPERLVGRVQGSIGCDVYSLGVLLFECLTGGLPFEGAAAQIAAQASCGSVPDVRTRNASVPAALAEIVSTAMASDPDLRFSSMEEMHARLVKLVRPREEAPRLLAGSPAGRRPGAEPAPEGVGADQTARRRYPRAPYVTPVRLILGDGSFLDGRSEDISEGGMLAIVPERCESSVPIRVRFALPVTGRVITAQARSRWVRVARTGAAAGLEFDSLSEEHRAAIRSYVVLMHGE